MNKVISTIGFLAILLQNVFAQNNIVRMDSTKYYNFHLNYYFNMHHFLWMEAFMNVKADSTLISTNLPGEDQVSLSKALNYYKEKLVEEDLRMSDYMYGFKKWLTQNDSNTIPEKFKEHMRVLRTFDGVYRKQFWSQHSDACKKALKENIALIRKTEEGFVDQITKLTRQFWQEPEKVRVDVTYFGKANDRNFRITPYTTIFPTHVVMNVAGQNDVKGNWLELLYHESAHHLILGSSYFVGGTIKDLAETEGFKVPGQLWHAYLFYFTGKTSKELLEKQGVDYPEIYMKRVKVFYRYLPLLEKHLDPYMERKITLNEATRRFITDFYE